MCFHIICNARYSTIVKYHLLGGGGQWTMVPKIYHFYNVPSILPFLEKGRTTVE